ncbi:MAG: hypothetical protein HYU68_00455 [Bacteroidetes bacterium]|nr:hypothetical protein [Bacteroidota bacterium]
MKHTQMTFVFYKWVSLVIAIIAFALRIYHGKFYEHHSVNTITGETRMDGSVFGYIMAAIGILSIIAFAIFTQLSKRKKI